ncbi:MAG: aromatic amino acid transport family protein [Nanoarchaeota archaeon]|nr:aromatic amino acid transport family protein [Nanoarchaeota archaeon]
METKRRKLFSVAFTLTGTVIGAGILGLPYVFAQSGFLIGLFWLVFLGIVMTFLNLWIGEITLRTKKTHQLPGYAEKYLGKKMGKVLFVTLIFGIYSALIAYLIGEGQSLSRLFFGNVKYSLLFGIGFWAIMTFVLQGGIRRLKSLEFWSVVAILLSLTFSFLFLLPDVRLDNISYVNPPSFFLPFGVMLFSLLGFNSVPELRREVGRDKRMLKGAIIIGSLIPVIVYLMFSLVFVGVLGKSVGEVATLSFSGLFGKLLILFGIFTMMSSFFVLSFALRDSFIFDLKKKSWSFFFVSFVPLVLYLFVSIFELANFVRVLGIGGAVSGGLTGIIILLMNKASKEKGDIKPEYSISLNGLIVGILSLIFLAGIFFEVFR